MLMTIKKMLLVLLSFYCYSTVSAQTDTIIKLDKNYQGYYWQGKIDQNKSRVGEWLLIRPDSSIKTRNIYKDNRFVSYSFGTPRYFDPNMVRGYIEGFIEENVEVFDGKHIMYHVNSKHIHRQNMYKNGSLEGGAFAFNMYGDTLEVVNYIKGLKNGIVKSFYAENKIKVDGTYLNDKNVGIWKSYYKNGNLESRGLFIPSYNVFIAKIKKNNTYVISILNEQGDTIIKEDYTRHMKAKIDGMKKTPNISFPFNDFFKDGIWEYWNKDGVLVREELYYQGNLLKITEY